MKKKPKCPKCNQTILDGVMDDYTETHIGLWCKYCRIIFPNPDIAVMCLKQK